MIPLNDGTSVTLEEFNSWHHARQTAKTTPLSVLQAQNAKRVESLKRAINTPYGQFPTLKEAVEKTNISSRTLLSLLKNKASPEYSYVNPKPRDLDKEFYSPLKDRNSKKTVTPLGVFNSILIAANAHGLTRNQFNKLLKTESENYYLEEDGPTPNKVKIRKRGQLKNQIF